MSHRGGVLGWPEPLPPAAKYAFVYLFAQAEFGLLCPVSVTDTSTHLLRRFGDDALRERLVPRMLEQDLEALWKGTQFITEKAGGSDVGALETVARRDGEAWRLYGEKWFCSHADADVALLLARPEGAPAGTRGLALFAMPWRTDDGRRNAYRIARLKDKLGTRSMASGEILLEGALAWPVGALDRGFKQMLEQVNLSRLSHGVRAAGLMRRCLNEARVVARHRRVFGRALIELPLLRRQLLKLLLPTEQALSMAFFAAEAMGAANAGAANGGDAHAARRLRMLTPLLKLRACRDNLRVASGAMEVRGGNGYIEDWVNARLVRDSQLGVIWEGTSNIVALDAIQRAVGRERAHEALAESLRERLSAAPELPPTLRGALDDALGRALAFAEDAARGADGEPRVRQAAAGLYNAASAILLAWEGARSGAAGGDARRLLLARLVLAHRLAPHDPLAPTPQPWQAEAEALLLDDAPVPLAQAQQVVSQR
jgi:alkylation response protein AidB-like acyl-CoA dehydrogenase